MAAATAEKTEAEFDRSKVDPAIVRRALKFQGVEPKGDADDQLAQALAIVQDKKKVPSDCLVKCSECNGISDSRLPTCPYCGEGDADAFKDELKAKEKAAKEEPADEPLEEEEDEPEEATSEPEAGEPEAEEEKPARRSRSEAKAKPKAEKPAKPPKAEKPPKAAKPAKAEIVEADAVLVEVNETELNNAIVRFQEAKRQGAVSYWELGRAIKDIHDRRLYTQRVGEDGKPKYKSWQQFCQGELDTSAQHAQRAMDVAEFPREEFDAIGIAKLSLIAKLPPALQEQVSEKARAGLPLAQVSAEVQRLSGREPTKAPVKQGPDQLKVVVSSERIKVKMFKRAGAGAKKDAEPDRAMKIDQDPSGSFTLPDGTELFIRWVLESKGLTSIIEFRKPGKKEKASKD